jgi:hypothetical protein
MFSVNSEDFKSLLYFIGKTIAAIIYKFISFLINSDPDGKLKSV